MGFRFRKSIRLFPGLRINLSESGASISIGKPGATMNISDKGARTTLGLPGTGISYTTSSSRKRAVTSLPTALTPTSRVTPSRSVPAFFCYLFCRWSAR
jgi:hypothetical protein